MKSKFDPKSLALGAALGMILAFTIAAATTAPLVWEYSVVTEKYPLMPSHPDYERLRPMKLNQLPKEGWEIVSEYMIAYDEYDYSQNHNETRYARETILRRAKK